ncbi:MAG TPA: hypothetical protein DCM54_14235 [Gammaproteobacteria bacterium]|nr:hypothetical protein [Gammaproteobacteria bacterium]|tara:strand:+ start:599 stop:1213 length:615 start_codon:yes stop_codon:yes gene_type:complete
MLKLLIGTICLVTLLGCSSAPPKNQDDICAIFGEKKGWYKKARKASRRWGTAIPVMMAFAHQESGFRAKAKPPRKKILWIFPGPRPASAFGFAQATDETWKAYKKSSGRRGADRDDFGDAMDFIGWYNDQSQRKNKIKKTDAYHLYLAYHEGQGGFRKRSFSKKQWLKDVATKVTGRSNMYARQLQTCEKKLNRGFLRRLFGWG